MTSAYRTASTESLYVIADAVPINLILEEYRAWFEIRKDKDVEIGDVRIPYIGKKDESVAIVQDEMLKKWQDKGRIISAFFNVRDRMDAPWVRPNHHVTQMTTEHSDFQSRLATLGLVDSEICACGDGEDTAMHHLLYCPAFEP